MAEPILILVKKGIKRVLKLKFLAFFSVWLLTIPWSPVFAQGSITGTVNNSDMSIPADSELTFWGFLDDTDEEIRTELSDGAGYENGYWWDDFQNYLTEAPGNPYDYVFSNLVNGEFYHLEGLIPNNSYQEENIVLVPASNPSKPTGVEATVISSSRVVVSWNMVAGITYHVYRRYTSTNGSLFRLDDPGGSLANPGVSDSAFVDTTVDGVSSFTYMVIGEDASGNYTPHSDEVSANFSGHKLFIRGDVDGSGALTLGDGLRCFRCQFVPGWPDSCSCDDAMDADDNGGLSIGDCLRILRKQFVPGWQDSIPPPCCTAPADCGADPTPDELGCEEHPCMGTGIYSGEEGEARKVKAGHP